MTFTAYDICAGIGGLSLGLERAGFHIIGHCERDPYRAAWLKQRWPDALFCDDIKSITTIDADLLACGLPCQPASLAGPRKGHTDERFLWHHLVRILRASLPRFVLAENVPGFLTLPEFGVDWFANELESIGYETIITEIPASAVGAPQTRKRVFIVAKLVHANEAGRSWPEQCEMAGKKREICQSFGSMLFTWPPRPDEVSRIPPATDGVPARLGGSPGRWRRQKIEAFGDAVVPQVAEMIGRGIFQVVMDD